VQNREHGHVLTIAFLLCLAATGHAYMIAECGFNDVSGINSDATPNSPYQAGATILGLGTSETGWTDTWTGWTGGSHFLAQSAVAWEGDLALNLSNNDAALGYSCMRQYTDQISTFYVDCYVYPNSDLGNDFSIYTGENSFNAAAVASHVSLHADGSIMAQDGNLGGSGLWEDTGFTWTQSQWVQITQEINCSTRTWRLWVDGQPYTPADPLGFRHSVSLVDDIRFLLPAHGADESVIIDDIGVSTGNPVPEPGVCMLFGLGLAGLALWRRCRTAS